MEIWKDIKGYEEFYQVSNLGRVRSKDRVVNNWKSGYCIKKSRILKNGANPKGYAIIGLWKNHKQHHYPLHRIVAQTFIPNTDKKREVNHIDGNKKNNNVNNLEWTTRSENMKHAARKGLLIIKRK